jgi:long-subunit acyl-CoA synthetase (AMP-forming)
MKVGAINLITWAAEWEHDTVPFTSGTSAQPKGVVLNFREYLLNIDPVTEGFGITAEDRVYDFRPFSWASAQLFGALAVAARAALTCVPFHDVPPERIAHLRALTTAA